MASQWQKPSFAQGSNTGFLENLYELYKSDPSQLDESWRQFFQGYEMGAGALLKTSPSGSSEEAQVEAFVNAYRRLGHLSAHLNPLEKAPQLSGDLSPQANGLGSVDQKRKFRPSNLEGIKEGTFSEIQSLLQETYCGFIGADFREINHVETILWFQKQMESCRNKPSFTKEEKLAISKNLGHSEGLEKFLQARFLGQKRFSLEGLESLVPLLETVKEESGKLGVEEVCIGMAHRGRLNVLANIMGKSKTHLLQEFEGQNFNPYEIDGDVKYHLGFAQEEVTKHGHTLRLMLMPNPSHLEAVNPVVEGFTASRQKVLDDKEFKKVLPVLIHGDSAIMGQGIVSETFNLSQLEQYSTGGTVHIITNNQLGFTTNPEDYRSGQYSSDVAKIVRAPVLHVNADEPESVVWVAKLAAMFRNKFGRDIVIDLIGYRKHGHNETDEPSFTQPKMYKTIQKHASVHTKYKATLADQGVLDTDTAKSVDKQIRSEWQSALDEVRKDGFKLPEHITPKSFNDALAYTKAAKPDMFVPVKTGLSTELLESIALKITQASDGFQLNPKLARLLKQRHDMVFEHKKIDWPMAELLAFASLAMEGHPVRLSGQDCRRGTFSSRHGVWTDFETNDRYEPLNRLSTDQGQVDIIDSPLSEAAVVGFEFGYSVANPKALVMWEAQFGDFANGAQIIVDQFLSASEAKWQQTSNLVMLLPHGHEGMGPEHSSARPERYLQLCGNLNLQVAIPTTASQYFHLLRRQGVRKGIQKPLIVMTPKSLLRDQFVASGLKEFTVGGFQEIIDDQQVNKSQVKRMIFCSGKIYYDLVKKRQESKLDKSVAVVRIEQLYPFAADQLQEIFSAYPQVQDVYWCQEEPQNMGCWSFINNRLRKHLKVDDVHYVGRKGAGTTAEGSSKSHGLEQQRIIAEALGIKS